MKKILFICGLLSLTLLACSKDETLTTQSDSVRIDQKSVLTSKLTGNATIDDLYATMLNSKEYQDALIARTAFFKKMQYTGVITDINTTPKLLKWINDNLSKTQFLSVSEAEKELTNIHYLSQQSLNANIKLYEAVSLQPKPVLIWNQLLDEPATTASDDCGCEQSLLNNLTVSRQYYSEALHEAYYLGQGTMQEAEDCYFAMIQQDFSQYQDCIDRC